MSALAGSTQRKRRLKILVDSLNKCRLDLSLHKISTLEEVLKFLGVPGPSESSKLNPGDKLSIQQYNECVAFPLENQLRKTLSQEADVERSPNTNLAVDVVPKTLEVVDKIPECKTESLPYNFISKHPCTLFKHQTKAAAEILDKFLVRNKRAVLLQAGVGTGKTFIYGKVLAELWAMDYFSKNYCFSPWPALIITKASIVKQTERVLENAFGLEPVRQFYVMNYDGLRSSKGLDRMMDVKVEHKDGVRVKRISWKFGLHPKVIIVDECQSAKNENSQQSQVVQAIATIPDPSVKVIFSSATAFTRVSEAKYLCVNLGHQYSLV
jgi:Type III restriction enzyme, res subunit